MIPPDTSGGRSGSDAGDPAPRRRTFLDSAEPLTAWRVDLADLIGVVPWSSDSNPDALRRAS
jgi:hypothetical protein